MIVKTVRTLIMIQLTNLSINKTWWNDKDDKILILLSKK
jgi:hypothetical protein